MTDLRIRDRLNRDAARLSKLGGTPKAQARALGVSPRRIRQIQNEEAPDHTGAPQRAVNHAVALATGYPRTSPMGFLLTIHAAVQERLAERFPAEVEELLRSALERETEAQAHGDIAEFRLVGDWTSERLSACLLALELHANSILECIGLARVLRVQLDESS